MTRQKWGQENGEITSDRDLRALTQLAKMTGDPKVMDDYVTVCLSALE